MGGGQERGQDQLGWDLGERVKELAVLHAAARLLDGGRAPTAELLQELVVLVPRAWQFPELCEARIVWLNLEARTPGWRETPWIQRASFGSASESGSLEIAYRERPRTPSEQPFLSEEADLIGSLAEMLGASFGRIRAEQQLRERERRLNFLYELSDATLQAGSVDEILAIVVERLGRELGASRCAVAGVEADGVSCSILKDYTDGCASFVGPYELSALAAEVLATTKAPVVIRDVTTAWTTTPNEIAAREKNLALGVHAMIVASHVKNGALRAIMTVQQTMPRNWTEHEIMLVTETVARAWANIEQRAAEIKLRQNEGLLRIAGEVARLGGWSIELPDRITWSDEVCAIHDLPPGTVPTPEQGLAFYTPEHRDLIVAAIGACLHAGTPFDLELEIVSATGRRVWVRVIGRAERNAAGLITRVHGALQDVSDRRRLEEHLRQAQKMEAIGVLAASVAHDFNNVLSVILSYTSFIIDKLEPEDSLRADVVEIQTAGRRAAKLTSQLLTFGRQQEFETRRVDLHEIVLGIEKLLRRLAGPRIQMSIRSADGLGTVLVDPGQIEQVLMNLVVNARDAMTTGGDLEIALENATFLGGQDEGKSVPPGRYVTLMVRDTGHGMDAATRARIFEPFFTTKEKGKGTGLGLATAYGVVTQSGGTIRVKSQVGEGTTFTVYFPRVDESAREE